MASHVESQAPNLQLPFIRSTRQRRRAARAGRQPRKPRRRRLLHRQIGWPLDFEKRANISRNDPIGIDYSAAVGHQATGRDESSAVLAFLPDTHRPSRNSGGRQTNRRSNREGRPGGHMIVRANETTDVALRGCTTSGSTIPSASQAGHTGRRNLEIEKTFRQYSTSIAGKRNPENSPTSGRVGWGLSFGEVFCGGPPPPRRQRRGGRTHTSM
jgi:hypothetical protein